MAEEIKAGGESSQWQGDCKPNRTRTVTAILESAMNKEEGQEERLSEHQFSNWRFVTEMNFISYDCQGYTGIVEALRHITRGGRSSL